MQVISTKIFYNNENYNNLKLHFASWIHITKTISKSTIDEAL
jgi:hypothetical protein